MSSRKEKTMIVHLNPTEEQAQWLDRNLERSHITLRKLIEELYNQAIKQSLAGEKIKISRPSSYRVSKIEPQAEYLPWVMKEGMIDRAVVAVNRNIKSAKERNKRMNGGIYDAKTRLNIEPVSQIDKFIFARKVKLEYNAVKIPRMTNLVEIKEFISHLEIPHIHTIQISKLESEYVTLIRYGEKRERSY